MSGVLVNPPAEILFQSNAIVTGKSRRHSTGPIPGTLSIKTVASGLGRWRTAEGDHAVTPETYLVLNQGQTYDLEIDSVEMTETFCVFFAPGTLESIRDGRSFGFYERLALPSARLAEALGRLRVLYDRGEHGGIEGEEATLNLAVALLDSESGHREIERLEHATAATREEVFARLNRARDYGIANLPMRPGLSTLAGIACLSPYHFHRLHKQAFGETPHEFLTSVRMARACRLLAGGHAVLEVTLALGFESVPTFTRLFRNRFGTTPGRFSKIG